MDSAFKITTMSMDCTESALLLGDSSGELLLVDTDSMAVLGKAQGNVGTLYAIATHPNRPLAATMGMDCFVCLWDIERPSAPRLMDRFNLRRVSPWNDLEPIPVHPSHSQALCFHPHLPCLATRSGNAGLVELDYGGGKLDLLHCTRVHGDEDLTTVRYVLDGRKLASGGLGSVVLSEEGLVIQHWRIGKRNVHWFEPIDNDIYLIATDDRRVLRFDFRQGDVLATGPITTRDDLEHVTYNRNSGRAYVAGFDRNVYEVDPESCANLGVVYQAPFKMRWIKTLQRQPDTAFLQCFDGGVYKVDLARRRSVAALRHTPPALWAACELGDGHIVLAGEGDEIVAIEYANTADTRCPKVRKQSVTSKGDADGTTKRMISDDDGALWLAQSSGTLIRSSGRTARVMATLGSPVRDIAANRQGDRILACLEDGSFHSIDKASGETQAVWRSPRDQPLWALAAHPEANMVAVGERGGTMMFLDASTAEVMREGPASARIKRCKWLDEHTLLYNFNDGMYRYDWRLDRAEPYVAPCGNTVEDFIWNDAFGYLLFITYNTDIVLCDLGSGEKIHVGSDQSDFSKGLMWLPPLEPAAYPLDFITFGRSGTAHVYRVQNNKIVPLGPLAPQILRKRYRVDRTELERLSPEATERRPQADLLVSSP